MLRLQDPSKLAVFVDMVVVAAVFWSCAPETRSVRSEAASTMQVGSGYRGVVIEEVREGSAPAKAGLQAGDVIVASGFIDRQGDRPQEVRGRIESVFDWLWLEMEQAPTGPVKLIGERDGEQKVFEVRPGLWDVKVRARMPPPVAEDYLEGQRLVQAGDPEPGIAFWQRAVETAQLQGNDLLLCWLQLRIGEVWTEQRVWEKAHTAYRSALEASREPSAQVAAWDALGKSYQRENEPARAQASYRSALEIRRKTWGESLGLAASLMNLGTVAWERGELELARDHVQRALEIRERVAPGSLEVAASLGNLGLVAQGRGELERAVEYHQRSLEIQEKLAPEGLEVATSLANLGLVAQGRGELELAVEYHQRSLVIRDKLAPGSLEVAKSLGNLGIVALERSDLELAETYLHRTLEIVDKLAPESLTLAATLDNLGIVAITYNAELEQAENHYQRALEIKEKLAPGSLMVAYSLSNLGDVAIGRGDFQLAEEYYHRALEIGEQWAPGSLYVAHSLDLLGLVARFGNELELAEDYHHRALEIREELAPGSLAVATVLNHLGIVAQERGELEQAATYFNRSIAALETQTGKLGGSYDLQSRFRDEHGMIYRNTLKLYLELDQPERAFDVLERYRASTFLAMLTERDLDFSIDIPEELARERQRIGARYDQALRKMQAQSAESEVLAEELRSLLRERDELIGKIRATAPQVAGLRYPQPLRLAEVQQILDPGTVLLAYSVAEERTDLFVVTKDDGLLQVEKILVGDEELSHQVERFLEAITTSTESESQFFERVTDAGQNLYRLLVRPAADAIELGDRLLILPDGPLHTLPFGALIRPAEDGGGGQYLVEWKSYHTALSATVYARLRQRPRRPNPGDDSALIQMAAFGDPRFPEAFTPADCLCGSGEAARIAGLDVITDVYLRAAVENRSFNWCPLCYSRQEVSGVVEKFPQRAHAYLGAEATEEQVRALARRTPFLHFATHAHFDARVPLNSAVVLSVPEDLPPERENGLLQVWEIFERIRIDADLVVLSGCETGVGELQGGEGLIGLTRAFQYAGARSVIATLWSVDDAATADLMVRFYRHLKAGKSKDEALRAAQIDLIRGRIQVRTVDGKLVDKDATAPFYWAAFQLYGDWP